LLVGQKIQYLTGSLKALELVLILLV